MTEQVEPFRQSPVLSEEVPTIVIQPSRSWFRIDWAEIWQARQLMYFLTWRDISARYKQTVLGPVWAIIPPIAQMVLYTFIFGRLAGLDKKLGYPDGYPYPLFIFSGMLLWNFFTKAVTLASNSLVSQAQIVTKVYFPRLILPAASIGTAVVDFLLAMLVYAGLFVYYGMTLSWDVVIPPGFDALVLPVLFLLAWILAFGVGTFLGSFIIVYRDFRMIIGHILHFWMFLSPVVYPVTALGKWQWLAYLNPMTGILSGFRAALTGQPVDWSLVGASAVESIVIFWVGVFMFRRSERRFADLA